MANVSKKPKQKPHELTHEELVKRDAMAFAELLYDIYQDKKLQDIKEQRANIKAK